MNIFTHGAIPLSFVSVLFRPGWFARTVTSAMPLVLATALVLGLGLVVEPVGAKAQAAANDVFEVKGVKVDVSADSVAVARDRALEEGEARALQILLKRLTLQAYHDRLPKPSAAQRAALVLDFSVAEEKASSVRYLATLNYRFKAGAVRALLRDAQIPFAETRSKPVLLLPVYRAAGALLLWDDPNPWSKAWAAVAGQGGLVPVVLAQGDLKDIATIGAQQALDGDGQRLDAIARRYDAGDSLVAEGVLGVDPQTGLPDLDVYVTRYGTASQEQTIVRTFSSQVGESVDGLLERSARQIMLQVEDNWKQDNLLQFTKPAVISAIVPISGLTSWVDIQRRLREVAVVRRVDIALLSPKEAWIKLNFIGDTDQLALSLKQADLILWREADTWYLSARKAEQ
ncbi:DUF2066 domain-containing protein [Varunaivibrio sulfuroxidans]|uniref:Uncharacterized protein DUF2066 n=1 Tax=Varunaivibrio sulfuroxidans TaxID=1773489 RepID=A0A4R3J4Z6_9PROT|nr:DUF2066 domain-containing protein [Varunaivibrio sulfuroxidans]TCS60375.1 uncharacterized protein DUF2066 [Varunaivibrio sulfuroxidans]WES30937.1 DUF2066 domain-containing protein [Varunaivibrio sulfuroxidans]